ncbi:methyl-accepting chemotaxis protein [Natronomonas sp.]|uniref:methyl-accepting chemotaxis protein n=1 Tax=Natronomonas sp. TaxID=2184060 RepID=UPI0026091940|nr:methyl-accepting chemotaxis protein [Natronomonas sp.]
MTDNETTLDRVLAGIPSGNRIDDGQFALRHRAIVGSLVVLAPVLFVLSRLTGTGGITGATYPEIPLVHGLVGSGLLVALAGLSALAVLPRRARSVTASFGFMTAAAVLAYFWGGFIEAHFLYFVGVGVVAMYEDWLPLAVGVSYVALQHSIFGQIEGAAVFNHEAALANPKVWGAIHAFFVLLLVGAILFQWRSIELTRDSLDDTAENVETLERQREEITEARREAEAQQERLDELNGTLRAEAADVASALTAVANRDLTASPPEGSDIEAVQDISSAYREMTADLGSVLGDLRAFADTVDRTTESVHERAGDLEADQREQADDVRELAAELERQAEQLESARDEMDDLSAVIEEIAASTQEVSGETADVAGLAEDGSNEAAAAAEAVEAVTERVETVAELTRTLDERMGDVEETTSLIDDIAEQTNILALNANIEAARADGGSGGSGGDGFGVVANEVKALAEETRGHSAAIQETTAETLEDVAEVRRDVERLESVVADGAESVDTVAGLFDRVDESAAGLEVSIDEVARATDDGAASTEEVTAVINGVADEARELARKGNAAADASEATADGISGIREELADLSSQTATLQRELDEFTLPSERDPTAGAAEPTAADD